MPYFPYLNATNISGMFDYVNNVTAVQHGSSITYTFGGLAIFSFYAIFLLSLNSVSNFEKAFATSSLVTMVLSIFMTALHWTDISITVIFIALTIGSIFMLWKNR